MALLSAAHNRPSLPPDTRPLKRRRLNGNNNNNNNNSNQNNIMPPLSYIVDLTQELSDNSDENEMQIIDSHTNYNNNEIALYNDLTVERKNQNETNNDNENNENNNSSDDEPVIVTNIRKPTIDEEKSRKNRRLQKIEQWLVEDNDEYLTDKLRKLLLLCPICQESLIDKNPTSTPCGHVFCNQCLSNALNMISQCPMCQKPISITDSHKVYL